MNLSEFEDKFLNQVVTPYWSSVYKYIFAILYRYGFDQVKNEAEDIRSEVFAKLWERYRNNSQRGMEGAFIFLVTANLVRDRIRYYTSDIRNVKITGSLDDENTNGVQVRESIVDDKTVTQEKQVWLDERLKQLESCLKKLKPKEGWALVLDAAGYSDKEIATIIQKDEKQIRSILPHAREKIRKYMNGHLQRGLKSYESK